MENHDTTETSDVFKADKLAPQRHNENGEEILDPTPMQPPLGYKKTLSLHEQIAQQVRLAKMQLLDDVNLEETDEEADDFDIGDDFEPVSPHENDHIPSVKKMKAAAAALNKKIKEAQNAKAIADYKKANTPAPPLAPPADPEPPTEPPA